MTPLSSSELLAKLAPAPEVEGEMHADAALSKALLDQSFPGSRLSDAANLLVMPNRDAANITFNTLKTVSGEGLTVGPILLSAAKPVPILTLASPVRRLQHDCAHRGRRHQPWLNGPAPTSRQKRATTRRPLAV